MRKATDPERSIASHYETRRELIAVASATEAAAIAIASAATATAASTAEATAAAATTAAAAAAAATAALHRFIHAERAAAELLSVERCDRCLRVFVARHRHEREPARTAGLAIHYDRDLFDRSTFFTERSTELVLGRRVRQVSNVEFLTHFSIRLSVRLLVIRPIERRIEQIVSMSPAQ
jgi:hypothetical protein